MRKIRTGILAVSTTLVLAACIPPTEPPARLPVTAPTPPPDEVAQGMAQAIADTGFYTEIALTSILGRHHDPARNTWTIIACFDFMATDGSNGTNCLDSFTAKQLDNGGWLVSVTINEVYRWRAIGLPDDALPTAESDAGPEGQ